MEITAGRKILSGDGREFPPELFERLKERKKEAGDGGLNLLVGIEGGAIAGKYSGKFIAPKELESDGIADLALIVAGEKKYLRPNHANCGLVQLPGGAVNALCFREGAVEPAK